ncbi:cyclic nucleotide-binding domain-containing protein [Ancylothrix sp. D3o]|uniref:cyclic nucleotide-binding domain-containing protein n=1 Tax=Ancylothrix sp. D3o TaxID=2953691 RepID=UPI0035C89708
MYPDDLNLGSTHTHLRKEKPSAMRKVLYLLNELSERDLDWMLTNGSRQQVKAGTILIKEGEPTDALYIVVEGSLTVSIAALGGREISTIGGGEVLGEMSFVDDRPPAATVKAVEDALVLAVPRKELSEKLQKDVLFALRFYRAITKFLSTRLRGAVNWLSDDKDVLNSQVSSQEPFESTDDMTLASARFEKLVKRLNEKEG